MFTLTPAQDGYDRRTLMIEEVGKNDLSRWSLKLTTRDIPGALLKSTYKAVDIAILPESEIDVEGKNIFLIPVEVRTIIRGENTSRLFICHTDQKTTSSQLITVSPELVLDCYVTIDNDHVMDYVDNPYLKIEFSFSNEEAGFSNENEDNRAAIRFLSSGQLASEPLPMLHTSVNENANGGLDIPIGKSSVGQTQENREEVLTP